MIIRKCDICTADMDSEASAEQTRAPYEFPINGIVKAVAIIRLKGMEDPADICQDCRDNAVELLKEALENDTLPREPGPAEGRDCSWTCSSCGSPVIREGSDCYGLCGCDGIKPARQANWFCDACGIAIGEKDGRPVPSCDCNAGYGYIKPRGT
jgi:hypothetical protein